MTTTRHDMSETTADAVVRFAREIGKPLTPWQEWIVRAYYGNCLTRTEDTPLTSGNPVITRDRVASL